VTLQYKQLWTVETLFRSVKSLLQTRPVYPKCDETIRAHVFCSFPALVLRKALQEKIEAKSYKTPPSKMSQSVDSGSHAGCEQRAHLSYLQRYQLSRVIAATLFNSAMTCCT
jgi:hypothetical protein